MADITLLQRLCELHGISGRERQVADVILEEISPFATTVQKDALWINHTAGAKFTY